MRKLLYVTAAVLLPLGACNGSGRDNGETISKETFVQAYYRLRVEGIQGPDMEIPIRARDRILADLGVTEEDLIRFAEVHGADYELMQGVWEEVDSLMRADRSQRIDPGSEEPLDPDPEVDPEARRPRRPGGGTPG